MNASTAKPTHFPAQTSWSQINLKPAPHANPERIIFEHLCPALIGAESAGLLTSWFFIRKQYWRIRYLPADSRTSGDTRHRILSVVRTLRDAGHIASSAESIYEPETCAFGGLQAMAAAHNLFHHDSRHISCHLRADPVPTSHSNDNRKEISYLLCAALIRAAGQDHYEHGDVWAKIADLRSEIPAPVSSLRTGTLTAAARRLITVDTSPGTSLRDSAALPFDTQWLAAFERTGQALNALATHGHLTRGIRAVLAHHVIFHWNRIGLPPRTQAAMATAAREAIFGNSDKGNAHTARPQRRRRD